jgi:hypothetical protein
MQMFIEITCCFKAMCDADKMPGYFNSICQSFIPAFPTKNFINDRFYFWKLFRFNNTSVKTGADIPLQLGGELDGHK